MRGTPIVRLMSRVDKDVVPGCWIWMGPKTAKGYGLIRIDSTTWSSIHRLSYEHRKGQIPEGLHIDHLCRNRACVNPDHLEAVTPQVNALRGVGIPARNAVKTHCPQNHPYDDENTYVKRNGGRDCRTCRAERSRARYLNQRSVA